MSAIPGQTFALSHYMVGVGVFVLLGLRVQSNLTGNQHMHTVQVLLWKAHFSPSNLINSVSQYCKPPWVANYCVTYNFGSQWLQIWRSLCAYVSISVLPSVSFHRDLWIFLIGPHSLTHLLTRTSTFSIPLLESKNGTLILLHHLWDLCIFL